MLAAGHAVARASRPPSGARASGPRHLGRGFTLLEVLIGTVVLATMLVAASTVMLSSQTAMRVGTHETALQAAALTIVDEIANDVKNASASDSTKYGASNGVVWFRRCLGFQGGAVVWSALRVEYRLELNALGQNLISRYLVDDAGNATLDKILSDEAAPGGFALIEPANSTRYRIFVRLERHFSDPRLGPQRLTVTAGTDVKRQN